MTLLATSISSGDVVSALRGGPHESGTRLAVTGSADARKDQDCLGWLRSIPPDQQRPWRAWMRRIRLADELAESGPRSIATLLSAWDTVCAHKFHDESPRAAAAWGQYLVALWYYHCGVAIRTITNHDEMLLRLSGPLLQLAPGMPEELWSAAAHFGALDQFWNNVRDMQEDAERGMCWLPESVLLDHGIRREDVMSGDAPRMSGWQGLMRWWLEARVARLEEAAASFIAARKPETLQLMQTWTLRRYARVACTFRAVEFDYRRFAEVYWGEVSQL